MPKSLRALAIVLLLTGCGPIERAQIQAQQEQQKVDLARWHDELVTNTNALSAECEQRTQSPELDSIRSKVELCKYGEAVKTTPFQYLSNSSYPTAQEKALLAEWSSIRDSLQKKALAFEDEHGPPPGLPLGDWNHMALMTTKGVDLLNELVVGLYQGKMTYGEFAKRRQDSANALMTALQEYADALREKDYQQRLAAATLAEEHYANQTASTQAYLNMIGAGTQMMNGNRGGAVGSSGRVICTNNSMASGTMPNSTVCQNF